MNNYKCRCCDKGKMYHMDATDGLCDACHGAGSATFTYSRDHNYEHSKGSGYTMNDAIQGHVGKGDMLSN